MGERCKTVLEICVGINLPAAFFLNLGLFVHGLFASRNLAAFPN